ncbi:MAG: Pyruvate carboxylase [Candidatus Carbobacillus altaicus]|uniref:pyruvate carboxylase n=1 Tax=Candidatus Carbonibacillus altaicus TaxID=2163959 RepID=A0A2R6Y226_9BACL|nr:MAG: Pyruvate carboxylase [Candidatus Carbobacillus altaicus]
MGKLNEDVLVPKKKEKRDSGGGEMPEREIRRFRKILVANRGEIAIRVFRAATELGVRTVAIYSEQDIASLHRYKADEGYMIGEGKGPLEAYLDIPGIVELAKRQGVDAVHPGYGFLSENAEFARALEKAGIAFIGPRPEHLEMFGDKVEARRRAVEAGLPVVPGTEEPIQSLEEAEAFAGRYGFPLMIKAAQGGGGRGMRVVRAVSELKEAFERARSEAKAAFGDDRVYLEKLIERPKHIEVQILGDRYGNVYHLYERDCSIQRRHQKVVEVAPARTLSTDLREKIAADAVRLMRSVGYENAGTVEFLVTDQGDYYFIEVNPRIQVEHTITELITDIDIVQAQIRLAEGHALTDEEVGVPPQDKIRTKGFAIQCRITTEDPENNFLPDTGRILAYRSPGGFGVRLDGGNGFTGAHITPHYDSLLVKACTYAPTFELAAYKMHRVLREFRIRGVKTNIPFLENVIQDEQFLYGTYDTHYIDERQDLLKMPRRQDRGTKLLKFIGEVVVNDRLSADKPAVKKPPRIEVREAYREAVREALAAPLKQAINGGSGADLKGSVNGVYDKDDAYGRQGERHDHEGMFDPSRLPHAHGAPGRPFVSSKRLLEELGPEGLARWVRAERRLFITDTTFRDAHQSLLATRVRTRDLLRVAEATVHLAPQMFSHEMWGGATFDVAMRFLKESPWDRLEKLREAMPNVLLQMLLRGSNAVGYTNYPDNVVRAFVKEAAARGMDVFRIFDSLNWFPGMQVAIEAVRDAGKVAEAAICYTGDLLDSKEEKYTLQYYVDLAKKLEAAGAHILAIKDMAGLLKPYAAYKLIKTLKEEVSLPLHLHTHDTSGNGVAMLLKAVEAGVDIVDAALSSMSGTTSQPSMNALVAALAGTERDPGLDLEALQQLADYWETVRTYYAPFESGMQATNADIYKYQMPGGQYTNLEQQAKAVGLGDRFREVKEAYALVNRLLGDIVKVTPSSKMVGDFALFMVQNNLDEATLFTRGASLDFPASVVDYFMGMMGQPPFGFPKKLQEIVLKGRKPLEGRPGEALPPVDWEEQKRTLEGLIKRTPSFEEVLSYTLYPKVFLDFAHNQETYGDVSVLDTPTFFYGLEPGEATTAEIEQGKTLHIRLLTIGEADERGRRTLFFELNGQPRAIEVIDRTLAKELSVRPKAEPGNPNHIGASMPGKVLKVNVRAGEAVERGVALLVTEAMKMELTIQAPRAAVVKEVMVKEGESIEAGDLVIVLEDENV